MDGSCYVSQFWAALLPLWLGFVGILSCFLAGSFVPAYTRHQQLTYGLVYGLSVMMMVIAFFGSGFLFNSHYCPNVLKDMQEFFTGEFFYHYLIGLGALIAVVTNRAVPLGRKVVRKVSGADR